jgi:hypothetical protein
MVGNAVLDVNIPEVFQSLAGKVRTFKTPCDAMIFGALAKTVSARHASRHHVVRMTALTACFFNGKPHSLSTSFQFHHIVCLMGEITGAVTAINTAYPDQLPVIFFHSIT